MSIKTRLKQAWLPYYLIPLILVAFVARVDVVGWHMFKTVSDPSATYIAMENLYMKLFHGLVYATILAPSLVVYYYQGLKQSLAYLAFSLAVIYSGLWDILYYLFRDGKLPENMNHLIDTPPGTIANLLGRETVTSELVAANALVFLGLGIWIAFSFRRGRLSELVLEF